MNSKKKKNVRLVLKQINLHKLIASMNIKALKPCA